MQELMKAPAGAPLAGRDERGPRERLGLKHEQLPQAVGRRIHQGVEQALGGAIAIEGDAAAFTGLLEMLDPPGTWFGIAEP